MPVSINLSNQYVKLVYVRNNNLERWARETLPAGMIKDGRILDPPALAGLLDGLFTSLKMPRSDVVVSLTGISFTYRILQMPRMKPALQQEAVERAIRKEIRVPLEELYLDWQVFAETGHEMSLFVSGIPRQLIDSLVTTMKLAGLSLSKVDINMLALARAVKQSEALVVDFEPDWFDIAIISGGIPGTLHSAAPKSKIASLEDNLYQLKDELNRTIDFFNLTHKDSPVSATTPLILTGSLAGDPALAELALEIIGRPLQTLTAPLKVPDNFPLPLYAGNLGLVMKNGYNRHTGKPGSLDYLNIDVDPLKGRRRSLARPLSPGKIIAWAAIFMAILLVIGLSLARSQAQAGTTRLQAEADRMTRNLRINRLALDEAAAQTVSIQKLTGETLTLREERETISGKGELAELLGLVRTSLPPGVNIQAINSTPIEITLEGEAARRPDILTYAENLITSGKFKDVRIALIEQKPGSQADNPQDSYAFEIAILR